MVSIIGLAIILINFDKLTSMNYPTDSFGNVCSDIQNFKFHNNNLAKKYLSPFTGKKFHHLQLNL